MLSANASDTKLTPKALIEAISQRVFIGYAVVYILGAIILSGLSEQGISSRWVYVDVGLCALFGEDLSMRIIYRATMFHRRLHGSVDQSNIILAHFRVVSNVHRMDYISRRRCT